MSTAMLRLTRAHVTAVLLASTLAVLVAAVASPAPSALLAGIAASTALAVVAAVSLHRIVAAPREGVVRVGHRGAAHRESFDRIAEPSHPDTDGRMRARAPGRGAPAA